MKPPSVRCLTPIVAGSDATTALHHRVDLARQAEVRGHVAGGTRSIRWATDGVMHPARQHGCELLAGLRA